MRNLLVAFIILLVVLAAARSGWLQPPAVRSAPLPTAASRTLARDADPIIITGQQMPLFVGAPLNKLFVYAYSGGTWQQIPWQFDEVKNGHYVSSDNGLLDNADELAVMASDTGDQAPAGDWISDASANTFPRYEITVTDPLDPSKHGWLYVYRSDTLSETVTQDYVDFNAATSVFRSDKYILGMFRTAMGANRLEINGSGVNILDRTKLRIETDLIGLQTEDTLQLGHPLPLLRDGRVRAIAGEQDQANAFLTIAYRSTFKERILLDATGVPFHISSVRASSDMTATMIGGYYYDSNTPDGVVIDGVPDAVPATPVATWMQASGSFGSAVQVVDPSEMGGTKQTYYRITLPSTRLTPATGSRMPTQVCASTIPAFALPCRFGGTSCRPTSQT